MATLRDILDTLRQTYCGRLGCEYMHIQHPEEKRWLQERMEPHANLWPLTAELKQRVLMRLLQAESFEHFLHTRFVGQKRFSLEGGEAAMVILDELMERAADQGVREMVIGMAHRGRLNVLANIVGKSTAQIFGEFEGNVDPETTQGSGDVKYHLGASGMQRTVGGREIKVSLSPNPSHLEAVDPVVEGIVRAKQTRMGDAAHDKVLPVLVHGDAAFAGQGVVAETLNLSLLKGYATGGTVHLVINNQLGFTTTPEESRSSTYCTDVARMVQAPILHVNGDDPEACLRAIHIAFDYRQQFKKDVVIDMVCYRKYGHNEGDDPSYTQPLMYRKIKGRPSTGELYAERLLREGVITREWAARVRQQVQDVYNRAHEEAVERGEKWELQEVTDYEQQAVASTCPRTAVDAALVEQVIHGITSFPADFTLHPKLKGFIDRRKELLTGGAADWATAEALAFGTLVCEGTPVRLCGQDSGRGTFSQRHLEYYDYDSGAVYTPMQHLSPGQARFEVVDSSLSEYGVMGFEFGYSLGDPLTLTLWEGQFGDFANGAQIMIDGFISCCDAKWGQPSGLVLLLPHGYEGQGPEHSSARIERFLQLCAEDNMQVCNCHHAGPVLPPAAPPDVWRRRPPRHTQAAGHIHAQEPAAPRRSRQPLTRVHPRPLRRDAQRLAPSLRPRHESHLLQRQDLLRTVGRTPQARPRGRRPGAAGADLPLARRPDRGPAVALPLHRRDCLVPGGAAQHGRVLVRARPHAGAARSDPPHAALRRPARGGFAFHRQRRAPQTGAGRRS